VTILGTNARNEGLNSSHEGHVALRKKNRGEEGVKKPIGKLNGKFGCNTSPPLTEPPCAHKDLRKHWVINTERSSFLILVCLNCTYTIITTKEDPTRAIAR